MKKKVMNDMIAFVKAIVKEKGRNEKVAVEMVTEALNLSAQEALKNGVIDLIAKNVDDLLNRINGKKIKKLGKEIIINSKDQQIYQIDLNFREKLLTVLTNPTIAYFLLMIGFYGIFFELYNPGSIVPGTIGAISLIVALYALNMISVNWLGVLLIGLGVVFFILEMLTPTFGALAFSGLVSMIFGSIILFSPDSPYGDISIKIILPVVFFSAFFFFIVAYLGVKAQRKKHETGAEAMIGQTGEALTDINPEGKVMVSGEIWNAYSKHTIKKGEKVEIVAVEGLKLKVRKAKH
jgi:membrane-bound serine protease (ClpP class)